VSITESRLNPNVIKTVDIPDNQVPAKSVFREKLATLLVDKKNRRKINTETPDDISSIL
jgi:hypothetical protein